MVISVTVPSVLLVLFGYTQNGIDARQNASSMVLVVSLETSSKMKPYQTRFAPHQSVQNCHDTIGQRQKEYGWYSKRKGVWVWASKVNYQHIRR